MEKQMGLGEELQVFEGDKAQQSKSNILVLGIAFVALGVCLRWIAPLYSFLGKTMTSSQLVFFTNVGWLVLVMLGICVFGGALLAKRLLEIALHKEGIRIEDNKKTQSFVWNEIKSILDYSQKQGDIIEVRLQNNKKSIRITKNQLKEFDACARALQQAQARFVLGRDFPKTLEGLQVSFGKELSMVNGAFYHKRKSIAFADIKSYTFTKTRPLYNSYDIYISLKNGTQISIFAQDVENRCGLLQVLDEVVPLAKV